MRKNAQFLTPLAVGLGCLLGSSVAPGQAKSDNEPVKLEKKAGGKGDDGWVDVKLVKSARDSWEIELSKDATAFLKRDDDAKKREEEKLAAWKKENPGPRVGGSPVWYCYKVTKAGTGTFEVRWKDQISDKSKTYKYQVNAK
jgi:hypothetical protein